jgi:hypothetical protein
MRHECMKAYLLPCRSSGSMQHTGVSCAALMPCGIPCLVTPSVLTFSRWGRAADIFKHTFNENQAGEG